ncbi:MAG: hypothetical protein ACRDRL_10880, partial [Sciscionella sp.]
SPLEYCHPREGRAWRNRRHDPPMWIVRDRRDDLGPPRLAAEARRRRGPSPVQVRGVKGQTAPLTRTAAPRD